MRDANRKMKANDGHGGKEGYDAMIKENWLEEEKSKDYNSSNDMKICICVRKRPMFEKEYSQGYFDCCSTSNPKIRVHEPKLKVDGITKYIDTIDFTFDNVSKLTDISIGLRSKVRD